MEENIEKSHLALWRAWRVCWPPSSGFLALLSVELGLVWWGMATDFNTMEIFFPRMYTLAFLFKECASETILYIAFHTMLHVALIYGPLGLWWIVFHMILRKYQPARKHWLVAVACMSAMVGLFLFLFIPTF